jgi:hypothetical protein
VVDPQVLWLAGLAIFAGAFVQGVVGMGVALVAAPFVAMLDPSLLPVSLLVVGLVLPLLVLAAERAHVDRKVGWVLVGWLAGTAPGVWVLGRLSADQLSTAVGALVLLGVALTVRTITVPLNRATLSTAGFVSAVVGTAASIGGPPLAILYQHQDAARLRSTLSLVFVFGSVVSLLGLSLAGQVHRHAFWTGVAFVPFLGAGFGLSLPLRDRLAGARFRAAVLVVVAISGFAALTQVLWR